MRINRTRMALAPLCNATTGVARKVCPPCLLTVASGNNVLILKDRHGVRTAGFFYEHNPRALAAWDAWLESRDAAHELPDGSLPRAA